LLVEQTVENKKKGGESPQKKKRVGIEGMELIGKDGWRKT